MKKSLLKIYLVFAAAILFCSCTFDELVPSNLYDRDDVIKIVGRVTPFSENSADTKSTKNSYETYIKNMALFVFDSAGDTVYFNIVNSGQPLFVIDRNEKPFKDHDQSKLTACKLYILANIPELDQITLRSVENEDDFLDTDCTIPSVPRMSGIESYGGLPMWGVIDKAVVDGNQINIDLRKDDQYTSPATNPLIGSVQTIPLTCMMSKLTFNITLDPIQKSTYTQSFELKSWTVENVPEDVLVAQPTGNDESAHADGPFLTTATFTSVDNGVTSAMEGGSRPMSFCCYVPEHRVVPTNTSVTYPDNITDEFKQNYKPLWLDEDNDHPIKVTLEGVYTDHRNQEKKVTYTIYPGEYNYKDFFVNRNHEYIHNITIKGITNSIYGDEKSITLDARVDVQQNDFTFTLERETLLDSHWEIRPIRVTLDPTNHTNADHIEIEIMNASSTPWIRMEMPTKTQAAGDAYCNVSADALAFGKRRYFTTDLVTNTLSSNTSVSFQATDTGNTGTNYEHVIWVYIDENTAPHTGSGSTTRQAQVQCRYYEKNQTTPTVTEDYYFIQKSLHNITYDSHTYGIEYYEEYLYNFDAREQYGTTTDGMAWGLNGVQLSKTYNAVSMSDPTFTSNTAMNIESALTIGTIKSTITSNVNTIISNVPNAYGAKYDFYLSRDNIDDVEIRDYKGKDFTKEIVSTSLSQSAIPRSRATNEVVQSAVEYCLNKNKRNSDGSINVNNITWYLPSIDEIEDITMGGYSDFEVFQDKYYWSSQPAYKGIDIDYSVTCWTTRWHVAQMDGESSGYFYKDNVSRARATKVYTENNVFKNVNSGTTDSYGTLTISHSGIYNQLPDPTYTLSEDDDGKAVYQEGNMPRTGNGSVNRIRCVYKAD